MAKDKKSPRGKKDKGKLFCRAATSAAEPNPSPAPKEKRAASPYNVFMKNELAKVKKANPSLNHKDAFKVAAQNVPLLLPPTAPLVP